jgi:DNA-binding NarL/FixJ family response regulator
MPDRVHVAIVDRSAAVRAAIEGDLELVGEAGSLSQLAAASDRPVDIVVADLRTCVGAERGSLDALRRRHPHLRLLVTTPDEEREYRTAAATVAADSWLPKTHLAGELVRALRRMAA